MKTILTELRQAYNLGHGVRRRLSIPFDIRKDSPTWPFGQVVALGHSHAYLEGGVVFGLAGMTERQSKGLLEHAKYCEAQKSTKTKAKKDPQ